MNENLAKIYSNIDSVKKFSVPRYVRVLPMWVTFTDDSSVKLTPSDVNNEEAEKLVKKLMEKCLTNAGYDEHIQNNRGSGTYGSRYGKTAVLTYPIIPEDEPAFKKLSNNQYTLASSLTRAYYQNSSDNERGVNLSETHHMTVQKFIRLGWMVRVVRNVYKASDRLLKYMADNDPHFSAEAVQSAYAARLEQLEKIDRARENWKNTYGFLLNNAPDNLAKITGIHESGKLTSLEISFFIDGVHIATVRQGLLSSRGYHSPSERTWLVTLEKTINNSRMDRFSSMTIKPELLSHMTTVFHFANEVVNELNRLSVQDVSDYIDMEKLSDEQIEFMNN